MNDHPSNDPDPGGDVPNEPLAPKLVDEAPTKRPSRWRAVFFTIKAIEIRLRFVAVLVVLALVLGFWDTITNVWDKWTRPVATAQVDDGTEYFCPMDPGVIRDSLEPDGSVPLCPICHMPLSKRNKGEKPVLPEGVLSRVQLSPERIQMAGIATVEAAHRPLVRELRTVGFVAIDETGLARIVPRVDGYVEKLFVNRSFQNVKAGEPLAALYSPELYLVAQELVIARGAGDAHLVDLARQKLRLLGLAESEIAEIESSGKASEQLMLRTPVSGHLLDKKVVEGDRVTAGQVLFEVADLRKVWVEAEVYEKDVSLLREGQPVEATIEGLPGRTFSGTVSLVHPHLEPDTRTIRVRFELENPGHVLRPGMYATVRLRTKLLEVEPFASLLAAGSTLPTAILSDDKALAAAQGVCPVTGFKLGSMGVPVRVDSGERPVLLCCGDCRKEFTADPQRYLARFQRVTPKGVLAVPEQAVIDTGDLKVVYVERTPGVFEGVEVTVGPRADGYYSIIDGLLPGQKVAAAGAFLIDAETRLNPGMAGAYFGAMGSAAGRSAATRSGEKRPLGPTPKEQANIDKLPEADRKLAMEQLLCPAGGERLGSMGVPLKIMLEGQPVLLCCKGCEADARRDPKKTLARAEQLRRENASKSKE